MPQSSIAVWLQRTTPRRETEPVPAATEVPRRDEAESLEAPSPNIAPSSQRSSASCGPCPAYSSQRPALHRNACMKLCGEGQMSSFHRLNTLLLPISYPQSFYDETLKDPVIASLTRIITWGHTASRRELNTRKTEPASTNDGQDGQLVAAIRCRLLPASPDRKDEETVVYISTIGVLAPFRRHSLASHLLAEVMQVAVEKHGARSIMGHVWEANEDAMQWYFKRGFEVVKKEKDYYRRLAPKTAAFLMRRPISSEDVLTWSSSTADG